MKKFIILLLSFFVPILVSSFFLDIIISRYLKQSNSFAKGEYSTWNDILDGKINSDIVIYGSSRAWRHFNSEMISNSLKTPTYNLGIDGHHFWLQYLRHKLLLKNNKKPKLIIFSLDDATLYKTKDLYNYEQFLPYMMWNTDIINYTKSYKGFNYYDYFFPLVRYIGNSKVLNEVLKINHKNNDDVRTKGFKANNQCWNDDWDKAHSIMKKNKIVIHDSTKKLFENFLTECNQNNINLVFVFSPSYIEGQKFIENRSEIMGLYYYYSVKHKIPFYDFSKDSICYTKENFYNSMHLNKKGSDVFTKKLIDSLKKNATLYH